LTEGYRAQDTILYRPLA